MYVRWGQKVEKESKKKSENNKERGGLRGTPAFRDHQRASTSDNT